MTQLGKLLVGIGLALLGRDPLAMGRQVELDWVIAGGYSD
jgi:hypothetical protein